MEKRRIGIFADYFEQVYQSSLISACLRQLEIRGFEGTVFTAANLVHTPGFYGDSGQLFRVFPISLQGLLLLGGNFTSHPEYRESFLHHLPPLPTVSLSSPLEGLPCFMVDGRNGVKRLTRHLIKDHGLTKIGFVKKLDGHFEGEQRFQAWKDTMEAHGLAADPHLILSGSYYADFSRAAAELFDYRQLKPNTDLEALFFVDSYSLVNFLPHLAKRGIRVPQDLALVCFDYPTGGLLPFQPTCEAQPFDQLASGAVETLLKMLSGQQPSAKTEVPTLPIPGNSCGCPDPLDLIAQEKMDGWLDLSPQTQRLFTETLVQWAHRFKGPPQDDNCVQNYLDDAAREESRFLQDRILHAERQYRFLGKIFQSLASGSGEFPPRFSQILVAHTREARNTLLLLQSRQASTHRDTDILVRRILMEGFTGQTEHQIISSFFDQLSRLGLGDCFILLRSETGELFLSGGMTGGRKVVDGLPRGWDHQPLDEILGTWPSFSLFSPLIANLEPLGYIGIDLPPGYWEDFFVYETLLQVLSGALLNCRNQTAKERSLNELRKTQEHLLVSEKMALLGGLVAGMAHEINTPIGNAVTAASFAQDSAVQLQRLLQGPSISKSEVVALGDNMKNAAEMLLLNCQRAADLIQSFKVISVDQTSNQIREFDLASYLEEIILSLRPQLKKTEVRVRIDCPAGIQVQSYPGSFSQVITNLVMNSLIHGFKNQTQGQIHISAGVEKDHFLILRYGDNGTGMRQENLVHLFEPFFTSMKNSGGSGLGTYMVYTIVTQHLKGSVHADSPPGQGLQYTIRIPLHVPEVPA